ncbi:hypothetical protein RRSWK_03754 [Rhodopirellula sp. SWK7]|nr:hypothetical protein RRSWK_03754 [Rhodopirellula sp. SWK7]
MGLFLGKKIAELSCTRKQQVRCQIAVRWEQCIDTRRKSKRSEDLLVVTFDGTSSTLRILPRLQVSNSP